MISRSPLVRSLALLFVAGCSESDSSGVSTPPAPPVEQLVVTISPKHDSLLLGSTRQLSASVATTTGVTRNVPVDFISLAPAIATVSNGAVTAIALGEARIVARAGTSTDTATLRVTPPNLELRLSPSAVAATLGDTLSFEAAIVGPNGAVTQTGEVLWTVSDTTTARVVSDGTVTTLAEGELLVHAQIGASSASAAVKVQSPVVASLAIVPSNLSISVGGRAVLKAEARDSRGRLVKMGSVKWTSSKPAIATVTGDGVVDALAAGGTVVTASVGGMTASAAVNVSSAAASSVTITLPNDSLGTGRTMQASATPLDATGKPISGRPLAWQSSNPSVATINSSGVVTALVAGQTTISVICDGKIASQQLTIAVPTPASVVVVPATALLFTGATASLSAEVRDQFGIALTGRTVSWASSATSVASVSGTGVVTGVALGSATVRATSGTLSGAAAVTVQNVPVASVTLSPTSPSVEVGKSLAFVATARDSAGNVLPNRPVLWASNNTAVASVSTNGDVQGIAVGTASIRATIEGKSATTSVSVTAPPPPTVVTVTVTLNSGVLSIGEVTNAKARAFDQNGVEILGQSFSFSSDDSRVATVSSDGRVKAWNSGSATITAAAAGEAGIASVQVQYSGSLPVSTVLLSAPTTALMVGDSTQLNVQLRDSTGATLTGRTISFTTTSALIASVSPAGIVRAVGAGTATITASSEGQSAAVTFSVTTSPAPTPAPVASVSVTLGASNLTVGQGTQATATLRDASNNTLSGRTIAWSSSNTAVATVNQNGAVTTVGAGSATISAQSEGVTGGAALSVKAQSIVAKTVQVSLSPSSIVAGGSSQATAVARDSAGNVISGLSVSWSVSSGASVASISGGSTGTTTVSGLSAGTAVIAATISGVTSSASLTVSAATPPPTSVAQPALPALLNFSYPKVTGTSWSVKAGDNLQTVLNQAQRGDEIVIAAGATFTGNFVLPAKSGTAANGWILIRSDKSALLPAQGTRVTPAHASLMPKIITHNASAALRTAPSASGWWISGVEFSLVSTLTTNYGLVLFGDGSSAQNSLSLVPTDLVLDRVYVHATPTTPTSRCIGLNSARSQVSDSYVHECHGKGFDTQAIGGWNGPGPFKIVNNTLAGAGENIMFGGSDPAIPNLIPSDIEIRRNYLVTPVHWKGVWTKKNLFELKNAQRLLLEGNVFDGSWTDGQVGWAFILKSANQSGKCTWCATRDVTIRYNIIRNAGAGFNLTGREGSNPHPVGELMTRVLIEQNIIENINVGAYTGEAKFIQVLQNLKDLTVRSNTMTTTGSLTQFFSVGSSPAATNVDYQNNVTSHGQYGLFSSASGTGEGALANLGGLVVWKSYVMIGSQRSGYPNGTFASDLASALATGRGANTAAVNSAVQGVVIP